MLEISLVKSYMLMGTSFSGQTCSLLQSADGKGGKKEDK
jgi:hypothetical protein